MKILIGINTLTEVGQMVYGNHMQFWFRLGRDTDYEFIFFAPRRMNIDNMRNMAAKLAIENECDYLLFIDDDVLVPFDTLQRLIACNADVAAGWTVIRGYPYLNMFFRWVGGPDGEKKNLENWPDPVPAPEMLECAAVGFSCCLLKVETLKKLSTPYFITGPFNTEDIYYCMKVQREVPGARIVVDTGVLTQHMLDPEFVSAVNKKQLKEYREACDSAINVNSQPAPETHEQQEAKIGDRSLPTYESVLENAIFGAAK